MARIKKYSNKKYQEPVWSWLGQWQVEWWSRGQSSPVVVPPPFISLCKRHTGSLERRHKQPHTLAHTRTRWPQTSPQSVWVQYVSPCDAVDSPGNLVLRWEEKTGAVIFEWCFIGKLITIMNSQIYNNELLLDILYWIQSPNKYEGELLELSDSPMSAVKTHWVFHIHKLWDCWLHRNNTKCHFIDMVFLIYHVHRNKWGHHDLDLDTTKIRFSNFQLVKVKVCNNSKDIPSSFSPRCRV